MNILVISPEHADLPNAASEIAAINRYHHAVVLSGPVRDRDIELAAEEGPFEIIWWITHGSKSGVLLTDGTLSIAGVGQYVRKSGAELCVLNTCDSEDIALAIVAGGKADIICTIGPVLNQDAIRLGSLLAGELAEVDDFHDAYEIVAPAGGSYRYLRANAQYRRRDTEQEITLKDIMRVLAGDSKFGTIGLVNRVEKVEGRLGSVESRFGDVEGHLDNVQTEIIDLKRIIQERFERGRVTVTPPVVLAVSVVVILLALALTIALWSNSRGVVDGQLGFAISNLLYI